MSDHSENHDEATSADVTADRPVKPGLGMPMPFAIGLGVVTVVLLVLVLLGSKLNWAATATFLVLSILVGVVIWAVTQRDLIQFRRTSGRWPTHQEADALNQGLQAQSAKQVRVNAARAGLTKAENAYRAALASADAAVSAAKASRDGAIASAEAAVAASEARYQQAVAAAQQGLDAWKTPGRGHLLGRFQTLQLFQHELVFAKGSLLLVGLQAYVQGSTLVINSSAGQYKFNFGTNEAALATTFAGQVNGAANAEVTFLQQQPVSIPLAEKHLQDTQANTGEMEQSRAIAASVETDQQWLTPIAAAERNRETVAADTGELDAAKAQLEAAKASEAVVPENLRPPSWRARKMNSAFMFAGLIVALIAAATVGTVQTPPHKTLGAVAVLPTSTATSTPDLSTPVPTDTPTIAPTAAPTATPIPTATPTPAPATPAPDPRALTVANLTKSINDNSNAVAPLSDFTDMKITISGGDITVTAHKQWFDEQDAWKTGAWDTWVVSKAILNSYPGATGVTVVMLVDVTDVNGQSSVDNGVTATVSATTAKAYDYGGLQNRIANCEGNMYAASDSYNIAPYIWSKLSSSQQGCMPDGEFK